MAKHRQTNKPSASVAPMRFEDIKRRSSAQSTKHGGKMDGGVSRLRLDRPGRKSGGAVGADSAPLSTAAKGCG